MAEGTGVGRRTSVPRSIILFAGALTAMGTGAIYMWSIFNKPLMDTFGFTTSEVSLAYSLFMLASCFSSMLAGWLQRRVQPRFIVLGAGIIFGIGWFGTGFADSLPLLYLFFSGCAGAGNGVLYNTIVAIVIKWFPDKRGFANGICIGAIGLSSMIFAPAGNFLIETFNVLTAFRIVGIVWLVVYLTLSWVLYIPPAGWSPVVKAKDGEEGPARKKIIREVNYSATQMFKTPVYYCLFLLLMLSSTSGLMITGHASNIGQELASLSASEGAIMVSILALGSTIGRFGFGSLSDLIGRYETLLITLTVNALVMLVLLQHATTFVTFLLAVSVVGACFGGTMTIMPAIVGDTFGSLNFGQNYSFVYPGYTVASFVGPMAAAFAVESAGTYVPAFAVAGALSIAGIVLVVICKKLTDRLEAAEEAATQAE